MQSDTALEVLVLLQEAGILTPAAAEAALQKVLLHYGQPMGVASPAPVAPVDRDGVSGGRAAPCADTVAPEAPTVDEYYIHDQQLHAVLLQSGRLTPAQLDTAVREQQVTGHPLWRTVINLELLTPQEMTAIIKAQDPMGQEQVISSAAGTTQEPGQTMVPQPRHDTARRVIEMDETASAVQIVKTIFEG